MEEENRWLKKLVADQALDNQTLREVAEEKREVLRADADRRVHARVPGVPSCAFGPHVRDAISLLSEVTRRRGAPRFVRSDNGPEFIVRAMGDWLAEAKIGTLYIEPGAPWENNYAESFHSRLRDELLNTEEFTSHTEAQVIAKEWKHNYNHRRPHSALDYLTPAAFAATVQVGKAKRVRGKSGQALLSLESEIGSDQEILSLGVVRKKG